MAERARRREVSTRDGQRMKGQNRDCLGYRNDHAEGEDFASITAAGRTVVIYSSVKTVLPFTFRALCVTGLRLSIVAMRKDGIEVFSSH